MVSSAPAKFFDLRFAAANPTIPPTAVAKWFMRHEPPHLIDAAAYR
jgi:hypothetical protein